MTSEVLGYRKTATIRATQYLGQHVPGVCTGGQACQSRGAPDDSVPHIHTLEGDLTVSHGDWIATGVKGEHWAIKPDVFAASYEPVAALQPFPPQDSAPSDEMLDGEGFGGWDASKLPPRLKRDLAPMTAAYRAKEAVALGWTMLDAANDIMAACIRGSGDAFWSAIDAANAQRLSPVIPQQGDRQTAALAPMPTALPMPEYRYQQEDLSGGSAISSPQHVDDAGWVMDRYTAQSLADLQAVLSCLDPDFPNHGDWSVSLPAGHWRAIAAVHRRFYSSWWG